MQIGIGLPATISNAHGPDIVEWARRADSGPFSSLGIIDRIAYGNHEPLITLAVAAGATQRIRLMSTVLLAPIRNPVLLAKQVASLDSLSNGRVTMGLGIGGRDDDYTAVGLSAENLGRRLEQAVDTMRRVWAGQPVSAGADPIGPMPVQQGGPPILIGGGAEPALRRAGRIGDGFISTPNTPEAMQQNYQVVEKAWQEAGKSGKPRFAAGIYFTLGDDATVERGRNYLRHYYSNLGKDTAEMIAQGGMVASEDAVRGLVQALEGIGMDEVVFWPGVTDLDQVQRLADAVA